MVTIPFSGIRLRRDLNMLTLAKADDAIRWHAGQRLNHLFEQRCDRFRRVGKEHHLAVVTDDVALSYEELDRRSNQAAKYLIAQGIAPGDRVALLFDKSHYSYIALLAVLKANAVYVPLDISYPVKRVEFILQDAAITTIVSLSCFAATLAEFPVRKLYLDTAEADIRRNSQPARFSAAGKPNRKMSFATSSTRPERLEPLRALPSSMPASATSSASPARCTDTKRRIASIKA